PQPSVSQSGTATLITGRLTREYSLTFDCESRFWGHRGDSLPEYDEAFTVTRVTNNSTYEVSVTHLGVGASLGPGETRDFFPPVRARGPRAAPPPSGPRGKFCHGAKNGRPPAATIPTADLHHSIRGLPLT